MTRFHSLVPILREAVFRIRSTSSSKPIPMAAAALLGVFELVVVRAVYVEAVS